MVRAAGDGGTYTVGIVDTKGRLVEELDGFASVTTIIGAVDASKTNALMGWAYNTALAGIAKLLADGKLESRSGKPLSEATIKQRMRTAKLTPWSNRDNAAARGTGVHDLAERLLRGELDYDGVLEEATVEERGYARGLVAWHKQYRGTPVGIERVCVSLRREYSGTADLIDELDGEVRVCDFKTSKAIYDSQFTQGTAYGQAWEEMCERRGAPVAVKQVVVIRFGADGTFEEKTRPYTGAAVFNAMHGLYRALQEESK